MPLPVQKMSVIVDKRFYCYTATFSGVAVSASAQSTVTIDSNADFFWEKGMMLADIAGATQTDSTRVIPLMTVQITDNSSGNQFFKNPIPVSSLFGTGETPYIMDQAVHIAQKGSITIEVGNFSALTTYNLRLVFAGYNAYYK